jgi:hypothetical protein
MILNSLCKFSSRLSYLFQKPNSFAVIVISLPDEEVATEEGNSGV